MLSYELINTKELYKEYVAELAAELFQICDTPALQYDLLCCCNMLGKQEVEALEKLSYESCDERMYYQANIKQKFYGFKIKETQEVVGLIGYEYINLADYENIFSISWTVVKSNLRSKGIGSQMLEQIEWILMNEMNFMTMTFLVEADSYKYIPGCEWVLDKDKRAIRFYEKNGYLNKGKIKNIDELPLPRCFFEDKEDVILVKKIKTLN